MDDEKQERSRKIQITAFAAALAMATPNLFMALEQSNNTLAVIWGVTTVMFLSALLSAVWARKK